MNSSSYSHKYLRICFVLLFSLSLLSGLGCAGSKLTAEEEKRYQSLQEERNKIVSERTQLAQQVQKDFAESGRLEKTKSSLAKQSLNCGFSLNNQAFGPLPFRKKKGKKVIIGSGGNAKRSNCTEHTFKVK